MTRNELLARRLSAQALHQPLESAEAAVRRLGAVQAQDYGMSLVALGVRAPTETAATIQSALDEGRLVRTHVLRPTWHLVPAADLRWLLALTAPRVAQVAGTGYRRFGLTPEVRSQARSVIEKALRDGPQTREELMTALAEAGLPIDGLRPVHYMMDAELQAVVCNGPRRGKTPTYDLVDRRIAPTAPVPPEEAAAKLAMWYAAGHGPATAKDFSWWSGLALTDTRRALDAAPLSSAQFDGQTVWYSVGEDPAPPQGFHWLPAFDEFVIAFADRTAAIDAEHLSRVLTKNGIFHPVVLHAGRACGTWKRTNASQGVRVEVDWWGAPPDGAEESRQAWQAFLQTFEG